jgi:hypothetical protein
MRLSPGELRWLSPAWALKLSMTMRRSSRVVMCAVIVLLTAGDAAARGTLRFGVMPLELESSSDTPLFGSQVDRAVDSYNAAAAAYGMQPIDASDLAITETLLTIAPGYEDGRGYYFFRIEAPIGLSADLKSVGLAIYPLNFQAQVQRTVALYISAGASASWLDRPGAGDIGGLVAVRGAVGARLASHVVFEIGYSAFALGGSINEERLANMTNPEGMPMPPDEAVSGGEASGLLDASIGITF